MTEPTPARLDLAAAAAYLGLPLQAVGALVASRYLAVAAIEEGGPEFQLSDIKAFQARNADNGAGAGLLDRALGAFAVAPNTALGPISGFEPRHPEPAGELEPEELIDLLDQRAEHMAARVFKIFSAVYPEASQWPVDKQGAFVLRAKGRFEAILAVTELGTEVDQALFDELRGVGESAAKAGTPLPQLLVLLRMSRDLVVQNAVELSGTGDGRSGGYALSLLLTRILPAMDRLGDALAQGYWETISRAC